MAASYPGKVAMPQIFAVLVMKVCNSHNSPNSGGGAGAPCKTLLARYSRGGSPRPELSANTTRVAEADTAASPRGAKFCSGHVAAAKSRPTIAMSRIGASRERRSARNCTVSTPATARPPARAPRVTCAAQCPGKKNRAVAASTSNRPSKTATRRHGCRSALSTRVAPSAANRASQPTSRMVYFSGKRIYAKGKTTSRNKACTGKYLPSASASAPPPSTPSTDAKGRRRPNDAKARAITLAPI